MKKIVLSVTASCFFMICSAAFSPQAPAGKNPYEGDSQSAHAGAQIFNTHCKVCHGEGGKGDICPDLRVKKKKYGDTDDDLFQTISKGRPGGMPTWESILGADKIWKVITFIRSIEK
jgi:mono/diheme cytochrome c family protein